MGARQDGEKRQRGCGSGFDGELDDGLVERVSDHLQIAVESWVKKGRRRRLEKGQQGWSKCGDEGQRRRQKVAKGRREMHEKGSKARFWSGQGITGLIRVFARATLTVYRWAEDDHERTCWSKEKKVDRFVLNSNVL